MVIDALMVCIGYKEALSQTGAGAGAELSWPVEPIAFAVSMCKRLLYNNNEAVFNFLCSTDGESGFTIIGVLSIVIGWVFCELWAGFFSSE